MPRTIARTTTDRVPPSAEGKQRLDERRAAELRAMAVEADRGATADLTRMTQDELRKTLFR